MILSDCKSAAEAEGLGRHSFRAVAKRVADGMFYATDANCTLASSLNSVSKHKEHMAILFSAQCGFCTCIQLPQSPGHKLPKEKHSRVRKNTYSSAGLGIFFVACSWLFPPNNPIWPGLNLAFLNGCFPSRYFHCQLTYTDWCQGVMVDSGTPDRWENVWLLKRHLGVASGGNRTSTTHSAGPSCSVAECIKKIGLKEEEKSFQMKKQGSHDGFHLKMSTMSGHICATFPPELQKEPSLITWVVL